MDSVSQPAVPCPAGPGTGSRPEQTGRLFLPMELDESGVAGRRVVSSTSGLPASIGVVAKVRVLSVRCCQQQSAAVVAWAEDVVGNLAASSGLAPGVARYRAVLNSHQTDTGAILREALETEGQVLALYKQLLARGEGVVGDARGVRPTDGPGRGATRRGGRQDAAPTGRRRRLPF